MRTIIVRFGRLFPALALLGTSCATSGGTYGSSALGSQAISSSALGSQANGDPTCEARYFGPRAGASWTLEPGGSLYSLHFTYTAPAQYYLRTIVTEYNFVGRTAENTLEFSKQTRQRGTGTLPEATNDRLVIYVADSMHAVTVGYVPARAILRPDGVRLQPIFTPRDTTYAC